MKISIKNKSNVLAYTEAFVALQNIIKKDTELLKSEADAVITHWLQSPSTDPLFQKAGTGKLWKKYLTDHFSLDKDIEVSFSFEGLPYPPPVKHDFKFIDLFAGIGGFRIALQTNGGKCVFSSDWDKGAKRTYYRNFGEVPFGDIKNFTSPMISDEQLDKLIPDHDVLAAGFPCQPFSRAGVSARVSLGRTTGFADETQGTLFFDIVRIVKVKQPKVLFLENVKNLKSHDGGRTFEVIKKVIEEELGYSFHDKVIDASPLVPQKRQRCYMVCFKDKTIDYDFPEIIGPPLPLGDILEKNVPESYTISIGHGWDIKIAPNGT